MKTILVLNAKGGCGKTTLSTNLASFYATSGFNTVLADFDPQQSSLEWLSARNKDFYYEIHGISPFEHRLRFGKDVERVILDAPARVEGKQLADLIKRADVILIPVLPSPIDMRAASHFISDLQKSGKFKDHGKKVALVANRVREKTLIYKDLDKFLKHLKIPFIATLRDTQNYIHAAEQGLGIFDMPWYQVEHDLEQWKPLTRWIERKLK
ncbi:MAG TPA: chromosome partitioning protein [Gammaproteobacteria bacterium]|nr:chromosome partitioning protein [Gammaproteobacteria bacterium]